MSEKHFSSLYDLRLENHLLSFEKEASKRQERRKRGSRERKEESSRTKGKKEIQACRKLALEVKRYEG